MSDNVAIFVTIGSVLTLASFVLFLRAGIDGAAPIVKTLATAIGVAFVVAVFIAGRYIFPTPKFISEEGFLIFNLAPFVQLLYTTALVLVAIPLIGKVSAMFRDGYAIFITFALSAQVVGAIVLITSSDTLSLLTAGWIIGLTYFALWTTLLFRKNIWKN